MTPKKPVVSTDSSTTEQPTWTKEALARRIAKERKETSEKFKVPMWLLDGFRSNGTLPGRD